MGASFLRGGTSYAGGKGRSYQHIVNLMPPHSRYIETHLGAGTIMRNKRRAKHNIGIDLDERVIAAWRLAPLADTQVILGCALDVLSRLSLGDGDLVYADPPYPSHLRRQRKIYRHDYRDDDHERLLQVLAGLPCLVMISGYANDLYDSRLVGWSRTDYRAPTQNGVVIESLWSNFQPGPILHDYSFVGSDFRDRERLRRRIHSLTRRLATASPVERNAVLAALADEEPASILAAVGRLA